MPRPAPGRRLRRTAPGPPPASIVASSVSLLGVLCPAPLRRAARAPRFKRAPLGGENGSPACNPPADPSQAMSQPDFIEVYDDVLDAATCRALIERFEACGLAQRGATGSGV